MQAAATPVPKLAAPRPVWLEPDAVDDAAVERLVAELRLPPLICTLLARRGYLEPGRAKAYLKPAATHLHSPHLLVGMADAVERLSRAVRSREILLVHGDYDVDGICATALLVRALTMMGGRAIPFVPHRLRDGYDLGAAGLAAAREAGAGLIVTADCGIVAHEAVRQANRAGLDVIVTDHHTPGETLPPALAVINPNRADCTYPDRGLAGAGVAFKLAAAVAEAVGFPPERLNALLDLVAVATIADLAPLTTENRAIVRWGTAILANTPNPGLRALLRRCGLAPADRITAGQIGFILAPRLNAAGRMGDAMRGVRLLLTDDPREATLLADELERENGRRRDLDEKTLHEALRMLEREYDPSVDRGVVLASTGWHPGVIGIVASRVVERIHRPTVLIALGPDEGKGSARSVRGFHLHEAFVACAAHLTRFGGHRAAAGCSLHPSRVEDFRAEFKRVAARSLADDDLDPKISIDAVLPLPEANASLLRFLRHFAPFGIGNPTPVLASYGVRIRGTPKVVGGKHLRLLLTSGGSSLEAIGFGMADRLEEVQRAGSIDVAFRLEERSWRGSFRGSTTRIQARLVDLRTSDENRRRDLEG